jgi:hypothetical protein
MKIEIEFMQAEVQVPVQCTTQPTTPHLPVTDALQIKAAEYWLRLGEADEALSELENLPRKSWESPYAIEIRVTALGMLKEKNEIAVQE